MTYSDKELEVILQNYKSLLSSLRKTEEAALYPHKIQDENTGGGKSNKTGDPTSNYAMALLGEVNEELRSHVKAIQSTYANVNVDQKRMMELYYFERSYGISEKNIAIRLDSDRSTLWRWRKQICKEFRKQLKRNSNEQIKKLL